MTGNLIGANHGLEALPERWRGELEYYDELIGLADDLLSSLLRFESEGPP
jgi:hypothetical protein